MTETTATVLVKGASQKARNLVNYRLRSESELRTRLSQHFDDATIDAAISQMYREGLLDDTRFAYWFVQTKTHSRPISATMIRQQLLRAGINSDLAKSITSEVKDQKNALQVAIKRSRAISHLPKRDFHHKMQQYLARRGFSFEVISTAVEESWDLLPQ